MLKFKSSPFEEDIEKATSENNLNEDWSLIMHICDNATNYQDGAKFCLKAIVKRLHHNVPRVVLQTLTLLDACVKNCDRRFLLQVASSEFTTEVRKLLAKMHPSASIKLKELLQKWSMEEFKDDPELCIIPSLYYKLKSEGVEFPPVEKEKPKAPPVCSNPDMVSSQEEENDIIKALEISLKDTGRCSVPAEFMQETAKGLPEPFKVRALYDFDAAEDNELTIKAGELVLVLDNSNANWWKGSNHRGEGLFPANFVTDDLDFKPDEPAVEKTITQDTVIPETNVKVQLDEKKIELVLNWLNDVDPTEEMPDPEEMLQMEREVYNMTSLIEENLQSIDNRIAMLNLVNEKIIAAFDLFHSLSDRLPANPEMKYYPSQLYNPGAAQFPHIQVSSVNPAGMLPQAMQPFATQGQISTLVPSSLSQSIADSEHVNQKSIHTAQISAFQQPQLSTVEKVKQVPLSENAESEQHLQVSEPAGSVQKDLVSQSLVTNQNNLPVGSYYIPSQTIPYPVQCMPNVQHQGYIQGAGACANFMPIPYPVPPVGPYFPFPYYYMNSNLPSVGNIAVPTSSSTSSKEEIKTSQLSSVSASESSITPAVSTLLPVSNYSGDLQHVTLSSSGAANGDQVSTPAVLQEINNHSSTDVHLQSDVCKTE